MQFAPTAITPDDTLAALGSIVGSVSLVLCGPPSEKLLRGLIKLAVGTGFELNTDQDYNVYFREPLREMQIVELASALHGETNYVLYVERIEYKF